MITGIRIPTDHQKPLERVEFEPDLRAIQGYVGGTVEVVALDRPLCVLWVNEDGKLTGLPGNGRATMLLWLHNSRFRDHDVLVGDVLLTGPIDGHNPVPSAPGELLTLLFDTDTYKVEVQTRDDDTWNSNDMRFGDWEEAYSYAINLALRWSQVRHVRVVPAG